MITISLGVQNQSDIIINNPWFIATGFLKNRLQNLSTPTEVIFHINSDFVHSELKEFEESLTSYLQLVICLLDDFKNEKVIKVNFYFESYLTLVPSLGYF